MFVCPWLATNLQNKLVIISSCSYYPSSSAATAALLRMITTSPSFIHTLLYIYPSSPPPWTGKPRTIHISLSVSFNECPFSPIDRPPIHPYDSWRPTKKLHNYDFTIPPPPDTRPLRVAPPSPPSLAAIATQRGN